MSSRSARAERERLERRARLHPGLGGLVELAGLGAAVHRDDRAGARLHRRQADVHVAGVLPRPLLAHRPHRRPLRAPVEGRRHPEAAEVDVLVGEAVRLQLAPHGVHQVVVGAALGLLRRRRASAPAGRRARPASSQPLADHAVEHVVEPALQPLGVVHRVVVGRRPDHRGEDRALGDREVLGVLAEVGLRRGLDAVGAATEVDGVEVVLEDLVLVVAAGQLHRDEELLELARVGALRGEVGVLRVLLGDRRAALGRAAADVGPERARDAGRRDAAVLVERAVLRGEHRLLHVVGHLVQRRR